MDKEKIYLAELLPLLEKLRTLCIANHIPHLLVFQTGPNTMRCTCRVEPGDLSEMHRAVEIFEEGNPQLLIPLEGHA